MPVNRVFADNGKYFQPFIDPEDIYGAEKAFYGGLAAGIMADLEEEEERAQEELEATKATYGRWSRYQQMGEGYLLAFCEEQLHESYTDDQAQIIRDVEANPTVLAKTANAIGKSRIAAALGVAYFLIWDDAQVFTFAAPPEDNLKLILWSEIGGFVERLPDLFRGFKKVSLAGMEIIRHSLSFLVGVTIPVSADPAKIKARFSGKHSPHQLFIGDEVDAVAPAVLEAIESCASGAENKQFYSFNPRNQMGPVYRMEVNDEAVIISVSAFNHPNVITGRDIIPGAVDREKTAWRINKWTVPVGTNEKVEMGPDGKPSRLYFTVPEFLWGYVARERNRERTPFPPLGPGLRRVIEPAFYYMVLGEYPALSQDQLIPEIYVTMAEGRWLTYVSMYGEVPPSNVRPICGLDVGDEGPDLSVWFPRYASFASRPIWWQGEDPTITGERAGEYCKSVNALYCNVDGTGVGSGAVRPLARAGITAYKVMVAEKTGEVAVKDGEEIGVFSQVRDEMLWYLRLWLINDPAAAIPPIPELREELLAPKYGKNIRGEIKVTDTETLKDILKRSPDHLMALALTFAPLPKKVGGFGQQNYLYNEDTHRRNGRFSVRLRS